MRGRQDTGGSLRRGLAVLVLLAGVLAMHALATGHEPHLAPMSGLVMEASHAAPDGAPCEHGCDRDAMHVGLICLAVVGGATGLALAMLALRSRGAAPEVPHLTVVGVGSDTQRRPPPRPPSLLLLCVART